MKEKIVEKLRTVFGDDILSVVEFKGELTVEVKRDIIADVCKYLKEDPELDFNYLADVCGADMLNFDDLSSRKSYLAVEHEHRPEEVPVTERFEVIYNLLSLKNKFRIRLKVKVDGENPVCPSVTSVHRSADWYERETLDMFGITFEGHPDMRRIYMPEEYEYYPLRKDFPLMGIPGSIPLPRK